MRFLKEGHCTGRGGEIYIYYIIYKFPLPACAPLLPWYICSPIKKKKK
jgi:hypothetical protein